MTPNQKERLLLGWIALVVGIGICLMGVTVGVVTTDSKWAACRELRLRHATPAPTGQKDKP